MSSKGVTVLEVLNEIKDRIKAANEEARDAAKIAGVNCCGACRASGEADGLFYLMKWIYEQNEDKG